MGSRLLLKLFLTSGLVLGCGCSSENFKETSTTTDTTSETDTITDTETESMTSDPTVCERFPNKESECVIFVSEKSGLNEPGRGHSWEMALAGVGEAKSLDSLVGAKCGVECDVWVSKGIYALGTSLQDFELGDNDRLYGGFEGNERNVNERDLPANKSILVQRIEVNGNAIIDGITKRGEAIVIRDGKVRLTNMSFIFGSSLIVLGGDAELDSSFIRSDAGSNGSYPANVEISSGNISISNSMFSEGAYIICNGASVGNSIISNTVFKDSYVASESSGCTVLLRKCEFTTESSTDVVSEQLGVYTWGGGKLDVEDSVFHDIDFGEGGSAVFIDTGEVVVKNTIFHSIKGPAGTVILNRDGYAELTNILVHSNAVNNAPNNSHGVILGESQEGTARFKIRNSIFDNSTPACFGDNPFMGDSEYDIAYSILESEDFAGEGVLYTPAVFVDAQNDDFRLASGSPGIDAADGDVAPELDKDGNARVDDQEVTNTGTGTPDFADMGVYERQP